MQEHGLHDALWRIDVVAIGASLNKTVKRIDHYPSAFDIDLDNR
jgi:hypothetical protein